MSQVNSVKDLKDKNAKCLLQNRGKTTLIDINSSSYSRSWTTVVVIFLLQYKNQVDKY